VATQAVRERLAQDVGLWLTDGLVDGPTHLLLRERFSARSVGLAQAVKYLGIIGGMMAFFGILGLILALAASAVLAAVVLLGTGSAFLWSGQRMAQDRLGRYGLSSKAVLTLGIMAVTGGIGVVLDLMGLKDRALLMGLGFAVLPWVGFLAYRIQSTFLLVLGLLGFFHWVGSWNSMVGRSTYETDIQDPRLMAVAALGIILVGGVHEQRWQERTGRFYLAYQTLGLVYLNLSLLILSIFPDTGSASQWAWVLGMALAGLAQWVAGARLHNTLFVGFGVTSLGLNLYTRYFEHFWNAMHKGLFLLLGGAALLAAGVALEWRMKQIPGRTA